ncbi:MAG: hypothetical protein E7Z65_01690 [Thermoplasmata archaeon]|nr:hypothetical protein [Thermoplasmata archaeon]
MNLEEGFHNSWKREGLQEALDSGIVISIEEHNSRRLNDAVNIVRRMMKSGFSLDGCLEYVGEDLKESVREQILKEQQS